MTIRLPRDTNNRWTQPNTSDKFGSLWATKNINLDEPGYIKLSPRSVRVLSEELNVTTGNAEGDVGIPVGIGKFSQGEFQVATTSNANFNVDIDSGTLATTENSGTDNPLLTDDSHAVFFQGRWFATTATEIYSKASDGNPSATWASSGITLSTNNAVHYMEVFASRNTLCITDLNLIKQYTNSAGTLTNTTNLTLPSDFEAVGLAYNNGKMGIITRAGSGSTGQVVEAKFYIWDGAQASATGYGVGSDACIAIAPYKSSFVILTRNGELKYFNGGGFEALTSFPIFSANKFWAGSGDFTTFGNIMWVEGDKIYINVGFLLNPFDREQYQHLPHSPSGVWCYDPNGGLYHRFSPSNSQIYRVTVSSGGTNTSTDVLTAATGTIPATGNICRYNRTDGTGITGLTLYEDYYIIKASSSTFSLATSRENALNGVKINLTAADSNTSYFFMYDLVDYGNTFHENAGAIASFGEASSIYRDVIFGGEYVTTGLVANATLCMTVPFLENRGWFILPRVYSDVLDINQKIFIKYRPLRTNDQIVVKIKTEDLLGLPTSSPNRVSADYLTWTSNDECYTSSDLSLAKTYFDAGKELELELVSGVGAGQMVKINNIETSGGVYSLELEDEVIGASSGLKSHFVIDNWRTLEVITDENQTGFAEIPVSGASKFSQFKVELRGWETTIEDLIITNSKFKEAQ